MLYHAFQINTHRRIAVALLSLCIISQNVTTPAFAQDSREEAITAAMIYNFARFTRWPDGAMIEENQLLTICVSRASPLRAALTRIEGKPVHGKPVSIEAISSAQEIGTTCQVIVLSPELSAAPFTTSGEGILYIATDESVAPQFASIALVKIGRQIRFVANPAAAKSSGVTLSSKLIDLAVSVR